jgi:hypothetical protein
VKKLTHISSNTNSIICPCCGIDELERSADGEARCSRCDRPISIQVLKTLEHPDLCWIVNRRFRDDFFPPTLGMNTSNQPATAPCGCVLQ